jgi:SAM-dependent methyltransferase
MGGRTFFTRLFLGEAAVTKMLSRRKRRILDLPDRKLLADAYLPAFAAEGGTILWVGCQAYTAQDYEVLERGGATVWTTDIDPASARWGHPTRHRTGDICRADALFPDIVFDAILCNGVLGYGADSVEQQVGALTTMAKILRPGGRLLLGWNTDKIDDPVAAGLTAADYVPAPVAGQPERVRFDEVTHVYDSFVRR